MKPSTVIHFIIDKAWKTTYQRNSKCYNISIHELLGKWIRRVVTLTTKSRCKRWSSANQNRWERYLEMYDVKKYGPIILGSRVWAWLECAVTCSLVVRNARKFLWRFYTVSVNFLKSYSYCFLWFSITQLLLRENFVI